MKRKTVFRLIILLTLLFSLLNLSAVRAAPPAPDDSTPTPQQQPPDVKTPGGKTTGKSIDQPNPKAVEQIRLRKELLAKGDVAGAQALAPVVDRVLVILVEFAGTDTFTWTPGVSEWDPLGESDPNEYTGTAGDCSLIQDKIEAKRGVHASYNFAYGPTLHNDIERPLSAADRSWGIHLDA